MRNKVRLEKLERLLNYKEDKIYVFVPPELGEDGKCIVTSDKNGQTWLSQEEYDAIDHSGWNKHIDCFKGTMKVEFV